MADSRIKDLAAEVSSGQIAALLNTLYLAVDDTSFSAAKKILLKTILTEAVVTSNANNYQAMTPKAFYDSVMTNAIYGIGRYATDAEVNNKSSASGLLTALHQVLMQTQWIADWFIQNGQPTTCRKSSVNMEAIAFSSTLYQSMAQYSQVVISPQITVGKRFQSVIFTVIVNHSNSSAVYSEQGKLSYDGTAKYWYVEGGPIAVHMAATGLYLSIVSGYAVTGFVKCSISVNGLLSDI